jgi:hypothetical protein
MRLLIMFGTSALSFRMRLCVNQCEIQTVRARELLASNMCFQCNFQSGLNTGITR